MSDGQGWSQTPPPINMGPPPRPRETSRRGLIAGLVIVGVLALLGVGALVAGSGDDEDQTGEPDRTGSGNEENPSPDVEITRCEADSFGLLSSVLEVTNHSSAVSSYVIGIVFESPAGDARLGTASVTVNDLEPGQDVQTATSSAELAPDEFTCRVSEVERS